MPHWFHWADHGGYNFVSGPLADITLVTAFVAAIITWWHTHNCHVHGCWRVKWHPHPEHGHPVCAVHHPDGHRGFFWRIFHGKHHTAAHILRPDAHRYDHHQPKGTG